MKSVELRIPRRQRGSLEIVASGTQPPDLDPLLKPLGCQARFIKLQRSDDPDEIHVWFEVRWTQAEAAAPALEFLAVVDRRFRVSAFAMQSESDD